MQLNPHYAELNESYLFSTIAHKVADYQKAIPSRRHPSGHRRRHPAAGGIRDGGHAQGR